MNTDEMGRKIDLAQKRLGFLLEHNQNGEILLQPEFLCSVLEELSITIEELEVQHQEILETRQILELERQRYQDLFDLAPDSYLVTDSQGIIRRINYATELLFNAPSNFILNKPLASFVQESDRPTFRNKLQELPKLVQLKDWEINLKAYQLKNFPASISVSRIQNSHGKIEGFRWQIRDLISCKQTELELIEAKELAESANRAKEAFLAVTSHEIRTPITAILGFCSLLLNSEISPKQKDWIETMHLSAKGLLNIINDILDFIKIDTGKLDLEYQDFQLNNCIKEVLNLVDLEAQRKGLTLSYNLAPDLPLYIKGDCQKLKQILINLLNNAIKFTDQGEINLAVQIIQKQDKITLEFAIKDTGIGIPYDRLNRLFKPFSQVDSSISRKYGGTGLGLAICQKLIHNMGGKIWVHSILNQGSTFYFTILTEPVNVNEQKDAPLALTAISSSVLSKVAFSQKPLKILLAEDENSISSLLLCLFSEMGINVDRVNNGQEAVQFRSEMFYDLILMDLQMPIMDGLEATRLIRKQEQIKPSQPRSKIIGLTANSRPEIKESCLQSGMDDYISKPFDLQNLINLLETL
jgi:PAS domain S-box-containing protein